MLLRVDFRTQIYGSYQYLWKEIMFTALYSTLVYYLYEHHELTFLTSFSFLPVSILSTVLSVFLAFRNNSAYDRWWEARKLWGTLVNASRTFAAQLTGVLSEEHRELQDSMLRRHVAFINLLRMQLRGERDHVQRCHLLTEAERTGLRQEPNAAAALNRRQADDLREMKKNGLISDYQLVMLLGSLGVFYDVQGVCERIKNTPFPRQSDEFIRLLLWVWIGTLPIYLLSLFSSDITKLLVIPLSVGSVTLMGFANGVGKTLEDPFENRVYDIPMTSLCEKIGQELLSPDLRNASCADEATTFRQVSDAVVW